MATAPRSRCVHCLKPLNKKTKDHAPPKSWYPRAAEAQCPTAPSCGDCNAVLGELEKSLLVRMGMCLDRKSPAVGTVVERALRSLDPSAGRSPADMRAREVERDQMRALVNYSAGSTTPAHPNFAPRSAVSVGIPIMHIELAMIAEKCVRVLQHHGGHGYVERDHIVSVATGVEDNAVMQVLGRLPEGAPWLQRDHAPGMLSISYNFGGVRVWFFRFWDRLNMLALSGPAEAVRRACSGWIEPGSVRRLRMQLPDSAYAAIGVTPPRPRPDGAAKRGRCDG